MKIMIYPKNIFWVTVVILNLEFKISSVEKIVGKLWVVNYSRNLV